MKLVYIYNSRMPIANAHGLQVMQMSEAFVQNKTEVQILAPMRVNTIKEDPFSYYKIKKTFDIKKLPTLDLINIFPVNIVFWIQTVSFLISCKIFLVKQKYDVIYTREQAVGLFFKDFVFEVHSLPKKIRAYHKFIWKRARCLIVLTPFIKDRIVESGISPDKIMVSPDGVKLEKFQIEESSEEAREKLNLPKNKKLIGYVGAFRTLGMEKGLDIAIRAMSILPDKDASLVLVGGHPADIEYYEKMVHELGLSDRIIFVGRISYELVPLYLRAFDILTAPFPQNDHYSYYMSPLKIFDYMAANKPIVSTNLPSLEDIIGDGEALLVSPDSIEDLADGFAKVLKDEELRKSLSSKAFLKIQELTWEKRAKRILDFIA